MFCYSEQLNRAETSVLLKKINGGENYMDGKMIVGISLILSLIFPLSLIAIPGLADVIGIDNDAPNQDQERPSVQDGSYDGDMLQERERLRLHENDCNGECAGSQHRKRQRAENRICNGEGNLEQHRYQNRDGTGK